MRRIESRLYNTYIKLISLPPCETTYVPVVNYNTGAVLGIYINKSTGSSLITERFIATDQITNQFSDRHDPLGVGISLAYGFTPWNNNVVVSPFVSFDYLNNPVNHTFAGGTYLGTTSNYSGTAGIKIGPAITPQLWVYGLAGVSVLNETMNINFAVASSRTTTVAGATFGIGAAYAPDFLQGFGRPVSLFFEYSHTWWQDAQFNAPPASPLFTYNFRREDDLFKFGLSIALNPPPPPARSPMYMKAPAK